MLLLQVAKALRVSVELCGSIPHFNVPLLAFAATAETDPGDDGTLLPADGPPPAAAVSFSSPVFFEQPSTVQTVGVPGSAVNVPADEDGFSLPSAFVMSFP